MQKMWESQNEYKALLLEETEFYNEVILGSLLPSSLRNELPHFLQSWLRSLIGGSLVYFACACFWSFLVYYRKRNNPKESIPSTKSMVLQLYVSMKSMPWYMVYQTVNEYVIESGITKCYPRISDMGWVFYLVYLLIYVLLVELGIYWIHRELHYIKPLYKYFHATHHIYNKQNTLTPFAGVAFHPVDGILQALPYSILLFIVPIHLRTHTIILFLEGLWATYIHDGNTNVKFWPILGSSHHTIHHTTYRHNYGHYTVLMDWLFGTLCDPTLDNDEPIKKMWESNYEYKALVLEETKFNNEVILGNFLPPSLWVELPHFVQSWMRNLIGGCLVYLGCACLWSFFIYYWKPNVYIPKENVPSVKSIMQQIYVTMKSMPWYMVYQTLNEYVIETGFTKCYPRISDMGWVFYLGYLVIYILLAEFGIYWMHRELHHVKPLYKYLHATHHIYNKQNTLSPFASLAFHPLDGILQAISHSILLFVVPMHFKTHAAILFLEGVWATNIHDGITNVKFWPIMGSRYHTIHHTTYRHNYGHYTVLMDWLFGTLYDLALEKDESIKVE